jgi:hypothetical protein
MRPSPEPSSGPFTVAESRFGRWLVAKPGHSITYAVATPGVRCGLVTVTCGASATGTEATVSYDLTALSTGSNAELDQFAVNYLSFLAHWERAIAKAIEAGR